MKIKQQYKLKISLSTIILLLLLTACSDWLRIDPLDKINEKQVFSSEGNIQQALNGIYIEMGKDALYGCDLSVGTIELLGQQYVLNGTSDNNPLAYNLLSYNYTVDATKNKFLSIWQESYSTILNINNFIKKLEGTENIVSDRKKDLMMGEAYGLRAYIHLDLLRLFGPIYEIDSTNIAIPYRSENQIEFQERIIASEVMGKIISDLDKSISLLKDDPIITEGVMALPEDSLSSSQKQIDSFYRYRNRRMNYFAASTLKVRALMYQNNKEEASRLAKSLLESTSLPEKFPWATNEEVFKNNKADRIFSSEVIFGVNAPNMYKTWNDKFSPGITNISSLYATLATNIASLFDVKSGEMNLSTDWRAKNWKPYTADEKYMVSYKLSKSENETSFWYFQPLIRKAELYYALAECDNDVSYLNEVRSNRNIKKIEEIKPVYNLETEIQNEVIREMHNEGQIFYYFKRKNMVNIPYGSSTGTISMDVNKYVIPVPQRELDK